MAGQSRSMLIFVGGLAAGGAIAWAVMGWRGSRTFQDQYVIALADQANVAHQIYSGHSKELADRIRQCLPAYVAAAEREFRGGRGREWTYWLVRDVYQASGTPVPESLKPIFASLPPRPSCKRPTSPWAGGAS